MILSKINVLFCILRPGKSLKFFPHRIYFDDKIEYDTYQTMLGKMTLLMKIAFDLQTSS